MDQKFSESTEFGESAKSAKSLKYEFGLNLKVLSATRVLLVL